jgi:arginase
MTTRCIATIGAPSSAGAFGPGQEDAPAALRDAGLVEALRASGVTVEDFGDVPRFRWRPDRDNPRAMNHEAVAATALAVAAKVAEALDAGYLPVVLGGDCTVELGTLAGVRRRLPRCRLLYFDPHPDLNTPEDIPDGTLDWMGVAHLLGEPGTVPSLSSLAGAPSLSPEDLILFGYSAARSTEAEHERIERHGIATISQDEVEGDAQSAAARALELIDGDSEPYVVHFDADSVDFADAPLAQNTEEHNIAMPLDLTMRALHGALAGSSLAAVTVTEINPHHGEPEGVTLRRFLTPFVAALAAACLGEAAAAPNHRRLSA